MDVRIYRDFQRHSWEVSLYYSMEKQNYKVHSHGKHTLIHLCIIPVEMGKNGWVAKAAVQSACCWSY